MSKRGNRQNRVCFNCRIKYPDSGFCTPDNAKMTSVCSECGGELCSIHDSVRVPPKSKVKLWNQLKKDYDNGTIKTPSCKSNIEWQFLKDNPDQALVHDRIERPIRNRRLREHKEDKVIPVIGKSVYKNLTDMQKEILYLIIICDNSYHIVSLQNILSKKDGDVLIEIKSLQKMKLINVDGDELKMYKDFVF